MHQRRGQASAAARNAKKEALEAAAAAAAIAPAPRKQLTSDQMAARVAKAAATRDAKKAAVRLEAMTPAQRLQGARWKRVRMSAARQCVRLSPLTFVSKALASKALASLVKA